MTALESNNSDSQLAKGVPQESDRFVEVAEAVKGLLAAQGPTPGSVVAAYVLRSFDFRPKEHGFASLSEFLRSYASGVTQAGKQGADVLWAVGSTTPSDSSKTEGTTGQRAWRALMSPLSGQRVVVLVHTGSGRWVVRDRDAPPEASAVAGETPGGTPEIGTEVEDEEVLGVWRQVPPMPPDRHTQVAEDFAARSEMNSLRYLLTAAMEDRHWWVRWKQLLGSRPDLLRTWNDERGRALRLYTRETLVDLGLAEEPLEMAVATLDSTRPAREHRPTPDQRRFPKAASAGGDYSLRDLAHSVIDHVDEEDLRRLRIPLGAIIDALRGR